MREQLWLRLRNTPLLRHAYAVPGLRQLLSASSRLLVPSSRQRLLRVRSGLGEGLLLRLSPRWEVSLWQGTYEPEVQRLLDRLLRPGITFYDIGAGIGFYSFVAARRGAQVFAFEPDEKNARYIEEHGRMNGVLPGLQVIHKAVYSRTGEMSLHAARWERGHGNAAVNLDQPASTASLRISCVTLDHFAVEHPLPQLLKVDVEGAESEVLKGGTELFSAVRPDLLCEVHDSPNRAFVEDWLRLRGYTFRWLEGEETFPRHVFGSARHNALGEPAP
ncbi:MAG: FkbM family methyltransferase [Thermoanaerobaculia bacterium]